MKFLRPDKYQHYRTVLKFSLATENVDEADFISI